MSAVRLASFVAAAFLLVTAPASAIVGGEVSDRQWPWMAAMEFRDSEEGDTGYDFRCGGSLVAPDVVLTAAHCVDADVDDRGDTYPARNFRFVLGTNNKEDGSGERIDAVQVVEHPEYDGDEEGGYDVALLKLSRPATLGAPIALAGAADLPNWEPRDPATVIGWGAEFFGSPFTPARLREATVPVRSDEACADTSLFPIDPATMVCAGNFGGGEDSCQGDSGGPLMIDSGGAWKQIGVVSFGFGCAFPTQYGVYAQVGTDPLRGYVLNTTAALTSVRPTTSSNGAAPPSRGQPGPAPAPGPATAPSGSQSRSALPSPPAAAPRLRVRLPRSLGSARRARRRGAFLLRLRFTAPVRVTATLKRGKRLLARGSRRNVRRGTIRMRLTRRSVRPGRAVLRVVAVDAQGRRITASRRVRLGR
jgi:secreted trypsin-like serine protease